MIGIAADDITGANDIGIMFAKSGLETHVYPMESWMEGGTPGKHLPDVLIIDTNSRLDEREDAYGKVYRTTKRLKALGCRTFINKTCSVFRGNIGAEFDAMLDALDEEFAVVVLGFPKNGRTTIGAIHYVHGRKLEDSEFRSDPVHPMTESNLVQILQSQTGRKVDFLDIDVVEQGSDALRQEITRKKGTCNYLLLDVRDQQSLKIIAKAVKDEAILCGSSALAEELALLKASAQPAEKSPETADFAFDGPEASGENDSTNGSADAALHTPAEARKVLCAAGSLMPQTAAQIAYAKRQGIVSLEVDSLHLLEPEQSMRHRTEVTHAAISELSAGHNVLIYSSHSGDKVAETKRRGAALGYGNTEVSRLVSDALSDIVKAVTDATGQRRLLIAGGETSAAVCRGLGVDGVKILREIEPGLPSCLSLSEPSLLLVLKSGSFGSEDFFARAIGHLKGL